MPSVFFACLLASALAFAASSVPQAPKPNAGARRAKLPALLQEIEARYAQAKTLAAQFSQVNESAAFKTRKASSGILLVKRPDKVRWETLSPDKNLLVSDGKKFWFYTPPFDEGENGQVIEKKSASVKSKLAQALLSGSFTAARDLSVRQANPSEFILVPKAGTAGTIREARIQVDPEEKLIKTVILSHRDGNRSEITLSRIELGKELGDELFTFEAPPGTDRVKE